ncbi:YdhK family protein [Brachybacterium paraconglomeratum]|uniref:YdhK family protein n=1 Tax=Brachybacterium paraconglomeratum TaxID=173362 RepID=UPI0031EE16BB
MRSHRSRRSFGGLAAIVLTGAIVFTGCTDSGTDDGQAAGGSESTEPSEGGGHGDMEHPMDGGPAPEGMAPAEDPEFPVGTEVTLTADHMEGMHGAPATISGAFDTTTYSVSFTPTDGGEPVTDHRWVVHEELANPGEAPLAEGAEAVITAEHMAGMEGAAATIDSATEETVYMVDYEADGMMMTNHKWVVESEIEAA